MLAPRPFAGSADLDAMAVLARACTDSTLHVVDLPYRLSSWAFDDWENARLWETADGQLAAWAVMQSPFWNIDYVYRPEAGAGLHRGILAWADERARRSLDTPSGRPMWFVDVAGEQTDRMRELAAAGFYPVADMGDDSWSKVRLRRVGPPPEAAPLPAGFALRPLAGEREVQAYVELHQAVFESKNMTTAWRARTLRRPEYLPDLDLVAVAPDGRLAGFCVGWLDRSLSPVSGQIEPMGVHADFRRVGLGRAILAEALRRLHARGARQVFVDTDDFRDAAFHLYRAAGFEVQHKVWVYRKDFAKPSPEG